MKMGKAFLVVIVLLVFAGSAFSAFAYQVMFNTKTLKYHSLTCKWAEKCTVNCIKVDHKEAQSKGGVPCKLCKGEK